MNRLDEQIIKCRKCPELVPQQEHPVPGEGRIKPGGIVVLGEGLGKDEAKELRPFIGRAGQTLRSALDTAGLTDLVYITNIVKCRPPGNRDPSPAETGNCKPWLLKQLNALDPLLIITVGKVSTGAMQEKSPAAIPILRIAGQTYKAGPWNCLATMHPAYVNRRRGDKDLGLSFIGHFRIALGHYKRLGGKIDG